MVASVHLAHFFRSLSLGKPLYFFWRSPAKCGLALVLFEYRIMQASEFEIVIHVTLIIKSSTNNCFPSVACSSYFLVSLFSFQGAVSNFFRSQIQTLTLLCKCLNPISDLMDNLVGPSGLEPPTSRLSVVRSSQLSYGPWWR